MDKSKKEEAKLEAEETFWEGPPSSTEALSAAEKSGKNHNMAWKEWCKIMDEKCMIKVW